MSQETNQASVDTQNWEKRAISAERECEALRAKVKGLVEEAEDYAELIEQAKIGIFQIQSNFDSMTRKYRRLLGMCVKHLDLAEYYATLDSNPLVRQKQINERVQAKSNLVTAIREHLATFERKDAK